MEKRCSKCREIKPLTSFCKRKGSKDGLNYICNQCNTKKCREWGYRSRYGISVQVYNDMYQSQGGKCLICQRSYPILSVDHDHATGKVRGLLCNRCNYTLGFHKERVEDFQRYIDYILTNL